MAQKCKLPPSAACLSASMRDLGYSLESAVADLIDNSISAEATMVNIFFDVSTEKPKVVIVDDGNGMTKDELYKAMRHGTSNPRHLRSGKDLGRFGLGLKTASFSQCRSLTVLSSFNGTKCAAEWDLDTISQEDDWILSVLTDFEIAELPYQALIKEKGTAVIWQKLDRLIEDESGDRCDEIVNEKLESLRRHLSLVFHRFLTGDVKGYRKLSININGHPVDAFDPFCRKNLTTQVLPEEIVRIGNTEVKLQPYILPHHSRLTITEYDYYQDRSDFISNQGAYIYRNGRLMAWGDWFRLVPKGEATKLARVQIDFPNTLDEAWTIDIKKSRARPPHAIRERLRQIIDKVSSRSVRVHRGRGQKLFQENQAPLWERFADHNGIRFAINEDHPVVASLKKRLSVDDADQFQVILRSISASLPVEMIYSDYSTHPREIKQKSSQTHTDALLTLQGLWAGLYGSNQGNMADFLLIIKSMNLFDDQEELIEKLIRENFI